MHNSFMPLAVSRGSDGHGLDGIKTGVENFMTYQWLSVTLAKWQLRVFGYLLEGILATAPS